MPSKNLYAILLIVLNFISCETSLEKTYKEGKLLYSNKEYNNAVNSFSQVINDDNKHHNAYYYRAKSYQKLENFTASLSDFNRAIYLNPKQPSIYIDRSISYGRLKNYDKAIEDLDYVIKYLQVEDDPINRLNIASAYNNRGRFNQFFKKDTIEALIDFQKSIKLNPNSNLPYYNIASLYAIKGNYEKAIGFLNQAIKLNDSHQLSYYYRAKANAKLNNYNEALADYDQSISLNPNHGSSYNDRGFINLELENYEKAIFDSSRSIDISNNPFSYNNRGFAKFKIGDIEGAILDCKKSLELNPKNSLANYNLGLIHLHKGRVKEACDFFQNSYNLGKTEAQEKIKIHCKQ